MPENNTPIHKQGTDKPKSNQGLNLMGIGPLSTEVHFWRELIDSLDEDRQSRESMERMRQALALAEYRLAHQAGRLQH